MGLWSHTRGGYEDKSINAVAVGERANRSLAIAPKCVVAPWRAAAGRAEHVSAIHADRHGVLDEQ